MSPERLAELREYAEGDDNLRDAITAIDELTQERDESDRLLADAGEKIRRGHDECYEGLRAENARLTAELATWEGRARDEHASRMTLVEQLGDVGAQRDKFVADVAKLRALLAGMPLHASQEWAAAKRRVLAETAP